jgi:hypothetical protein
MQPPLPFSKREEAAGPRLALPGPAGQIETPTTSPTAAFFKRREAEEKPHHGFEFTSNYISKFSIF